MHHERGNTSTAVPIFHASLLDHAGDGKIDFNSLKKIMKEHLGLSAVETKKIFDSVAIDGSMTISYTDFLSACTQSKIAIDDYMIKDAFTKFMGPGRNMYMCGSGRNTRRGAVRVSVSVVFREGVGSSCQC